jgi:argininosuccinate lyase
VALCGERQRDLTQLTLADYQGISPEYQQDLYDCFRLEQAMAARKAIGAPSPQNVRAQLARWQEALGQ